MLIKMEESHEADLGKLEPPFSEKLKPLAQFY